MKGDQLDIIDFIINAIFEQEKALDEIIERLEAITPTLEKAMNR